MLKIDLHINDRPIGEIGVHNTQERRVETDENEVSRVEVKYDVWDLRGYTGGELGDERHICSLWHDRSDGAAELTSRVMSEVPEDRLDTKPRGLE